MKPTNTSPTNTLLVKPTDLEPPMRMSEHRPKSDNKYGPKTAPNETTQLILKELITDLEMQECDVFHGGTQESD